MVGRRELDPAVRGRDLRLATGTLDARSLYDALAEDAGVTVERAGAGGVELTYSLTGGDVRTR